MEAAESKSYQLRVRVTAEERDRLEKLRLERDRGETISDLVREAISLLVQGGLEGEKSVLSPRTQHQVERLAVLLKREPRQVEEACVEGIIDLIESKCEVPLIVMETHLHLKYRGHDEKQEFPWSGGAPAPEAEKKPEPAPEQEENAA
jgi:hypothetical protein